MAKSLEQHIEDCRKVHGDLYDYSYIDNFNGAKTKAKIKCNKCNNIFEQTIDNHKNLKQGCPICNIGGGNLKALDLHIQNCIEFHGNKYDYSLIDNFKRVDYKVKIKCKSCNDIFEQSLHNHKNGKGCPLCKSSKMENKVAQLAKDHFISREKSFEGLVGLGGHPLRFDFEFKDFLLECQGQQHFKYVKGFHKNEKAFHKQVKHDQLKKDYCRVNNINLEFINYDEDVEHKLKEILAKYNINI